MQAYECVKNFSIEKCDGDGFSLDEQFIIEKQTVWNVPEDRDYRLVGGEIRLENDNLGWIEISKEDLQEYSKEAEEDLGQVTTE